MLLYLPKMRNEGKKIRGAGASSTDPSSATAATGRADCNRDGQALFIAEHR